MFVKSKQLSEMFGAQLPYLKDDIPPEVSKYLGIKTEATTESIIEYLQVLSTSEDADFKLVCHLYKYLNDYGKDYESSFDKFPLIYLQESVKVWLKCDEVVWEDLSSVFGDLYPGLAPSYENSELRSFFLKKLAVSNTVGAEELARAWLILTESDRPDPEKTRAALEKILPKVLEVASNGEEKPDWWGEFIENVYVWTQGGGFVSPGRALAADDRQLQGYFDGKVPFIWKPERYTHHNLLPLYQQLGVRGLSESTEISLQSSSGCKQLTEANILTEYSKRLLGYLVYNQSQDIYLNQIRNGSLMVIMQGVEYECAALEVQYSIRGFHAQRIDRERKAFWDTETSALYLSLGADTDDLFDEAAEAIAKALWGARARDFEYTVHNILGVTSQARY